MKKRFLLLSMLLILIVTGCGHSPVKNYNETKIREESDFCLSTDKVDIKYTNFNGHKYIKIISYTYGDCPVVNLVHDPDCPCYNK